MNEIGLRAEWPFKPFISGATGAEYHEAGLIMDRWDGTMIQRLACEGKIQR